MKIELTKNKFAVIDDEDFEFISKFNWSYSNGYARAVKYGDERKKDGHLKQIVFKMHRLVINAPYGMDVDHKNGDKLDNKKSNLRVCSHSENMNNQKKRTDNTSGYKGVAILKYAYKNGKRYLRNKPWLSYITNNKKREYLGYFLTAREAAITYNKRAEELHGEFANLNTI